MKKKQIINEVGIGPKTRQSDRKISPEELKKKRQNINGIFFHEKKKQQQKNYNRDLVVHIKDI